MMKEQVIKRLRNKAFWVAMASGVILLAQQIKPNLLPSNVSEVVNTVLTILTIAGVIIDPTTPGITDGEGK